MSFMNELNGLLDELEKAPPENSLIMYDSEGYPVKTELLDLVPYRDGYYAVVFSAREDVFLGPVDILELDSVDDMGEHFCHVNSPLLLRLVFDLFRERNREEYGEPFPFTAPAGAALRGSKPLSTAVREVMGGFLEDEEGIPRFDEDDWDRGEIFLGDGSDQGVRVLLLDYLEYNDMEYVVFLPAEDGDEEGTEVVILQLAEDDDGGDLYVEIEREDIIQGVYQEFREKHKDEFHFS